MSRAKRTRSQQFWRAIARILRTCLRTAEARGGRVYLKSGQGAAWDKAKKVDMAGMDEGPIYAKPGDVNEQ